ncbi:hypothetical protein SDC9_195835 [bioreactor metagenome]|uniref:Uncharacterized protein n=1 Tax=bioreactor metagenome TaxID=1076179 RepID=A0A645IAT2_9ZZZZ
MAILVVYKFKMIYIKNTDGKDTPIFPKVFIHIFGFLHKNSAVIQPRQKIGFCIAFQLVIHTEQLFMQARLFFQSLFQSGIDGTNFFGMDNPLPILHKITINQLFRFEQLRIEHDGARLSCFGLKQ